MFYNAVGDIQTYTKIGGFIKTSITYTSGEIQYLEVVNRVVYESLFITAKQDT